MTDDTVLSVQMYTLRGLASLPEQLDVVREVGLTHVEFTSDNYEDPATTRRLMDERGLRASGGHIGIEPLRERFDAVVELCGVLDVRLLVLWGFPEDEQPRTANEWLRAGATLGGFAQRLKAHDVDFAFHNHDWELALFGDGERALDKLFEGARGSPLGWQPDVAWLARGHAPVEEMLKKHHPLIRACHVKDLAPAGTREEDGWADLGYGTLDWAHWWPLMRGWGTRIMVLEHDEPSDARRFLRRSAATARALAALPPH